MSKYQNWNMQLTTLVSLIFLSFIFSPVLSAASSAETTLAKSEVGTKHSHNGRVHTHILPASGIKHFHRHEHNGRSHIHPYSADIGFKHTHSDKQKKIADNSVKHQHGDRWHSHPLPRSGLKHPHRHKHGSRMHTHPLPASGVNHYHRVNPPQDITVNQSSLANDSSRVNQFDLLMHSEKQAHTQELTPFDQTNDELIINSAQISRDKQKENITDIIRQLSLSNKITNNRVKPVRKHAKKSKVLPAKSVARKKQKTIAKRKKQPLPKPEANKDISITPAFIITPTKEQQLSSNRQFEIGLRYEKGIGVETNLEQAAKWYRRAAEQGHKKAQFNLASLYEQGKGVEKNSELAIKWYKAAAMTGEAETQ